MIDTIFILDENKKVVSVLTVKGKRTFFDDLYKVDLSTGAESYEFRTNIIDIEEGYHVLFLYHNQYKLFTIVEIELEHSAGEMILSCYAESTSLELINNIVRAFNRDMRCDDLFNYILYGTNWQLGIYSTSLENNIQTVKVDKATPIWTVIQEMMSLYGYEINTRVEFDNGRITNCYIDVYAEGELGNKTYKRFEYGRNIEGIIKKKNTYDWCTAIVINSNKSVVSDNDDRYAYDKDGYIKDKTSDVIFATNENKEYNYGKNYIYGVYEDNDSPDGIQAITNAAEELKRRATPKFDYEVTTVMTWKEYNDINIGDTIYCIDRTYSPPLYLEARIGSLELSFTNRNNCKCVLSNYKEIKPKTDAFLDSVIAYLANLEVGVLDAAAINQLIIYLQQLDLERAEVDQIVEELQAIYKELVDKERDEVTGIYVDILLDDSRRNYVCGTVKSMKFRLPSTNDSSFSTTLIFTTEKDVEPTKFYQSTIAWLEGSDCANGALIPQADTKYTIAITYDESVGYGRKYRGTVSKESYGGSYIAYNNQTTYTEDIVKCMRTYYDNRTLLTYNTTTPYSFKDPTTPTNQAKWITDGKYHIDCSTFVQFVTRGINYNESPYANPTVSPYFLGTSYSYGFIMDNTISDRDRFAADQARYCIENGWQLDISVDDMSQWNQLQPGDLVFWSKRIADTESTVVNERFMQVGHVAIISGESGREDVTIDGVTYEGIPRTFESTTEYTAESGTQYYTIRNRLLTSNYPEKLLFFARPRR